MPAWIIPAGPLLLLLAFGFASVAELGRRGRAPDLVATGIFGCLVSLMVAARAWSSNLMLGHVVLHSFGAVISAILAAGWLLTIRASMRSGLLLGTSSIAFVVTAASGLLGARLLYVITNFQDFGSLTEAISPGSGGLVFYGAVLGGLLGSYAYARSRKLRWLSFADACTPGVAFSSAVGRLGCYMAGCDYGAPLRADTPGWLVRLGTFPRWPENLGGGLAGSPPWLHQVLYQGLAADAPVSRPVHPTQLYESLASSTLFAGLLVLHPRRTFHGQLLFTLIVGYGCFRFVLELVRDDPERGFFGPLSTSQWIALITVPAGIAGVVLGRRTAHEA